MAIVKDGELVFAAAEERYTRIKQDSSFPVNAIKAGFRQVGIRDSDVDVVALSWPMDSSAWMHNVKLFASGNFGRTKSRFKKLISEFIGMRGAKQKFQNRYNAHFAPPGKGFVFVDHHAAHALSVFCLAETDDSVCVVFDGRGTTEATTIWKLEEGSPKKMFERSFPDSIGVMYANVTQLLGFQPLSDEWKVMGLAAYGKPNVDVGGFERQLDWETVFTGRDFLPANDHEQSRFEQTFGAYARRENEDLTQKHMDIAASAQLACEKAMIAYVEHATQIAATGDVCLAGGWH